MTGSLYSLTRRCAALLLVLVIACSSAKRPSRVVTQNSPSMRRIMNEWKQVQSEGLEMGQGPWSVRGNSSDTFRLKPVGNMFEWHFTFLGVKDSPFEGGLYHGSITLPPDYPQSGPSVRLLNPNQRFKVGSRICLSASEYHQESWQPSWTVTSLVTALVAHMTEPAAEIGSVQGATRLQKRKAAAKSRSFECAACGCSHECFPAERFPQPKWFDNAGRDRPTPVVKRHGGEGVGGIGGREGGEGVGGIGGGQERGARGVARDGAGVRAGSQALSRRSGLSWTVRLVVSKPVLIILALILASVFLSQPR